MCLKHQQLLQLPQRQQTPRRSLLHKDPAGHEPAFLCGGGGDEGEDNMLL